MATHEHTVVVDRPITTVYDQWTQFESYPEFMKDVMSVEQLDDSMTHWKVSVAGVEREYDAQILEQRPTDVISWRSVTGPQQAGRVSFVPVAQDRTRVTLRLDFEPHGVTENVGETLGVVASSVEGSLDRFKDYIEERDSADGGWRGTIVDGVAIRGAGASALDQPLSTWSENEPPVDLRDPEAARARPGGGGDIADMP
jgi:uncharacterized membrane protein